MRIDYVYIEEFKNLRKVRVDLDKTQMNTVLLGQNATGKSNFLEALIIIFKHLDLEEDPPHGFNYKIQYQIRGKQVSVDFSTGKYIFHVANRAVINGEEVWLSDAKSMTKVDFFSQKGSFLPKYIFTYYSGLSDRLDKLFWKHQQRFYTEIKKPDFDKTKLDDLRRLFYVKQIHSFFVLLAFFALRNIEKKTSDFLLNILGIEDLESVLFVLKKPSWTGKGHDRFWGAEGLVQEFLSELWNFSLAPIYYSQTIYPDFRSKGIKQEQLYLYITGKEKLHQFSEKYFRDLKIEPNNTDLFKALESTYISELLEEVRVRVRKKVDGKVIFKELSEGEQQLLTVIGLLIFTREEESLILLDEPDTHLNPIWKYDYLHFLKTLVKSKQATNENNDSEEEDTSTQIIINTHDPLVIGSMDKSQVRIFQKDKETGHTVVIEPDVNPKGLGVAGILTSELFGLKTIVDRETNGLLEERNILMYKQSIGELTDDGQKRLKELFEELSQMGFNHNFKDPLYSDYIIERMKKRQSTL
ncbi:MAG: AAA family ATPase [Bacteroidota bacterium]